MCWLTIGLAKKANMTFIHETLNKQFIGGIKSNRCIALTENNAKSCQFQQVNSLDWKDGDCNIVYLKDVYFPVKLLKKVFTNEDGSTGTLYLVTNDLSIDADRIYQVYQKRWRVEEFHKSIKQNASLSVSARINSIEKAGLFSIVKKVGDQIYL